MNNFFGRSLLAELEFDPFTTVENGGVFIKKREDGSRYLEFKIPGFGKKDIKVTYTEEDGHKNITVKGEARGITIDKTIVIPKNTNPEEISASVENGILTLEIPQIELTNKKISVL